MHIPSAVRMPIGAAGLVALLVTVLVDVPGWARWAAIGVFVVAVALHIRAGTPTGPAVRVRTPVRGRWLALNSPTSRVPSHRVHAWSQTYAVDLVCDPGDGRRPGSAWWPLARRPGDFPGFGQPVLAPLTGEVVRARSGMRDHRSRTSPPALLYFLLESVRELLGPPGVLGNHTVIRDDDGACVLLAHLRRHSLQVAVGDHVQSGQAIAACGNSGNSTEPHLHLQAMDRPSVLIAGGLPMLLDGRDPPADGEWLTAPPNTDGPA